MIQFQSVTTIDELDQDLADFITLFWDSSI